MFLTIERKTGHFGTQREASLVHRKSGSDVKWRATKNDSRITIIVR